LLSEVFSLLQLTSEEVAAKDWSTVLVIAISELLAGHEGWQSPASRLNGVPQHFDVSRKVQAFYPV
tara:strand:+ start:689 stop:886 length:198 start_codon:yes stop_codon:yes gene_type:complete